MAISMAKTRPKWHGGSRLDWPTWKVYSAPYHTPRHGRAWLRTIFTHSRHISRGPGGQKCFFLWRGCSRLDRPTSESAPGYTAPSLISQRIRLIKPHKHGAGGVQNMAILWIKTRLLWTNVAILGVITGSYGKKVPGWASYGLWSGVYHLESVSCVILILTQLLPCNHMWYRKGLNML